MSRYSILIVAAFMATGCGTQSPTRPSAQRPSASSSGLPPIVATGQSVSVEWTCVASGADRGFSGIFSSARGVCPERSNSLVSASSMSAAATAPGAPLNLTSTINESTVFLTWSPAGGADPASSYVIEAGSASGRSDLANIDTGSASPALTATNVPTGTYYVRVRARNSAGVSASSNEALVVVGAVCNTSVSPSPPSGLVATSSGSAVVLSWTAPGTGCAPQSFYIEAGSAPGRTDLADFPTGNPSTVFKGDGVPDGTYYVRVRSWTPAGKSAPSNEATLVVGPPACIAGAPTSLASSVSGNAANFFWSAPAAGSPSSYRVEIGTSPGAANISVTTVASTARTFTTTLSAGTYYIRVRAAYACGTSAASNEATATIVSTPAPTPTPTPTPPPTPTLQADFTILPNHPLASVGQCVVAQGGGGNVLKCIFDGQASTGSGITKYEWSIPALNLTLSGAVVTDPYLGACGTNPGAVTRDVTLTVTSPAGTHSTTKPLTFLVGGPC